MALNFSLLYKCPPVSLLTAAADAAGRSSPYRNVRWGDKAYVVCHLNQGNATPITLTLLQSQNVAGLNSKVIRPVPIWLNDNTATSDQLMRSLQQQVLRPTQQLPIKL